MLRALPLISNRHAISCNEKFLFVSLLPISCQNRNTRFKINKAAQEAQAALIERNR